MFCIMVEQVIKTFKEKYASMPSVYKSPGRVNILGEHTDYNEGFVLPAAIDKAIYVAISRRTDNRVCMYAADYDQSFECNTDNISPITNSWTNYILGVVDQLLRRNYQLSGFNLVIDGDIPIGAGLSSSAAVECATAFALNDLFSLGLEKLEIVKIARSAEHEFAGVKCGIMDQFASVFGKKDHVIKLDCRSLEYQYIPLHLEDVRIVLFNTNVKHNLAASEYNIRRAECERGVALIKAHHPGVQSLRDVSPRMVSEYLSSEETIQKRCQYIVEENGRLLSACEDLKNGNLMGLGKKMFLTHHGLSRYFEVSCRELDYLVDTVRDKPGVIGARMMGGGFGGCTINLVKTAFIEQLVEDISEKYEVKTGLPLSAYVAEIQNGTSPVAQVHQLPV